MSSLLFQNANQLTANELRVGRRNSLAQLMSGHPVNSHGRAGITTDVSGYRDVASRQVMGLTATTSFCTWSAGRNDVPWMFHLGKHPVAFKPSMTIDAKAEHSAAKNKAFEYRCTRNVFDYVWKAARLKKASRPANQVRVIAIPVHGPQRRVGLAWRTCMNGIVNRIVLLRESESISQRVSLNEFKRVTRLRLVIDADDPEPSSRIAYRAAAGAAEEIKEKWSSRFLRYWTCMTRGQDAIR